MKARIVAALEAAGEEGIHRDELGRHFAEVANATISVTLSNLKNAGRVRPPSGRGPQIDLVFSRRKKPKTVTAAALQLP